MNRLAIFFSLLVVIIGFSSCGTTQIVTTAKKKNSKFLFKKLEKNKINFDWFGSKAKLKYEAPDQKISTTAIIRMKKDSLIWISIKKLSIEGARMRITPQTIEVLDRQNSKYIRKPFSAIKDDYGLEISFAELQDLLVGNPVLFKDKNLLAAIEEDRNVLRTAKDSKTVLKLFFENGSFLLSEMRGSMNNNAMSIVYEDYQKVEKEQIATRKKIEIDSEEKGIVELNIIFTKVELNVPQKVKFVVPDSYRK